MKDLIIFGKTDCINCDRLKMKLDIKGISYKYLLLDKDYKIDELMKIKPANARSFPFSFYKESNEFNFIKNEDI